MEEQIQKTPLFVMYYMTTFDDIIQSGLWVIPKEGKKLENFEYLKNQKSFSDEIKSTFHSFWRAIIWWKKQALKTNSSLIQNNKS